jgi:alanine racemase
MTRPARALIDLQALQQNFARVSEAAPNSRVMAIVKANAYGHGMLNVARALSGADAFGVASLEEAIALREGGIEKRVVLLEGFCEPDELDLISSYRLDTVLHHDSQIEQLRHARPSHALPVWLKIDTGMNRLGFPAGRVRGLMRELQELPVERKIRFMSHLACADELHNPFTRKQLERFEEATRNLPGERSIANSAGILGWPDSHLDWVRPGIMLYGASPFPDRTAGSLGLKPVMSLSSVLISVKQCRKGDRVGYGGEWVCPGDMNIGVAAIGYGDGYPRHASSGTPVLVNGNPASLIGRVSMDMIIIDLDGQTQARVGDPVMLWGDGLPVDRVAANADTISYQLLCGLSPRVALEVC